MLQSSANVELFIQKYPDVVAEMLTKHDGRMLRDVLTHVPLDAIDTGLPNGFAPGYHRGSLDPNDIAYVNLYHDSAEDSDHGEVQIKQLPKIVQRALRAWYKDEWKRLDLELAGAKTRQVAATEAKRERDESTDKRRRILPPNPIDLVPSRPRLDLDEDFSALLEADDDDEDLDEDVSDELAEELLSLFGNAEITNCFHVASPTLFDRPARVYRRAPKLLITYGCM